MRSPGANEHEEFTADDALGQVWARRLSCDGVRMFEILNASLGNSNVPAVFHSPRNCGYRVDTPASLGLFATGSARGAITRCRFD
jgi:hypothetical protein